MIVNAPNFVLSLPGNTSPNAPVIGYHSLVTIDNIQASEVEDGDNPVSNLANSATHLHWISSTNVSQYLTIDQLEGDVDYVGIAGHNFGSERFRLSVEAYFGLDELNDPVWEVIVPDFMVADDRPLFCRFTSCNPIGVRVYIDTDETELPRAAVLHIGKSLVFQRNIYVGHTPITYGRKTNITNGRSESGNFLGRLVIGRAAETSVSLQHLTPNWYRTYFDPFVRHAEDGCFFFAWCPATYPEEVGYAWLTDDPAPANMLPNGMMEVSLSMGGIIQ